MSRAPAADATEIVRRHTAGEASVASTIERAFDAISELEPKLSMFLNTDREGALERARVLDRGRRGGEAAGALFGVPVVLKANMCLAGVESNCGSRVLRGYRAPYTATFVQRMLDAGAVVLGMGNMDEFAMGSSSENSAFGPTRNPWDVARIPGGSSSGSAVAVASGVAALALGSDTGGSVRQPSALCGIAGFKPTYGRVSRYGLIAFGSSLDQVSPFARSVRDLERVLSVISGRDAKDSTALDLDPIEPESPANPERLDGLRVGVPREYFPDVLESAVRARTETALAKLAELGAALVPIRLPHTEYAVATYYVVATAEASSNLARYDGVRYGARARGDGTLQGMFAATRDAGFGAEVKRRILLGTYVLSAGYYDAWYGRALKVRNLVRRDFDAAFADVDVIAGPTTPTAAFALGEKSGDPVAMYLSDILTVPISLAGLPAISVPSGFVEIAGTELPVGLQIAGPARGDARVLRVARAFESATDHASRTPPLFAHQPLASQGAHA